MENNLEVNFYFPCAVYTVVKPEFLGVTKEVVDEYVERIKRVPIHDELNPVYQTEFIQGDSRLEPFSQFVLNTAWGILHEQGYMMDGKTTHFESMWGQQYEKLGGMEQHIHNNNVQLVGFYFIDCPADSSRLVLHDPRAGKTQINLAEANEQYLNVASDKANFEPKPGTLMIMNSWMPHSFNRHRADEPFKFIHFNIIVNQSSQPSVAGGTAEVI